MEQSQSALLLMHPRREPPHKSHAAGVQSQQKPHPPAHKGLYPLPRIFAAACFTHLQHIAIAHRSHSTKANNAKELQSHRTQAAAKASAQGEAQ